MNEPTMSPSTWKAFCQAIIGKCGPPMEDGPTIDRPEFKFQCDRCNMEFMTAMSLEGKRHMALQNKCNGTWKILGDGAK